MCHRVTEQEFRNTWENKIGIETKRRKERGLQTRKGSQTRTRFFAGLNMVKTSGCVNLILSYVPSFPRKSIIEFLIKPFS
jgi:hypothetical protein